MTVGSPLNTALLYRAEENPHTPAEARRGRPLLALLRAVIKSSKGLTRPREYQRPSVVKAGTRRPMTGTTVLYCRVSISDQTIARQRQCTGVGICVDFDVKSVTQVIDDRVRACTIRCEWNIMLC